MKKHPSLLAACLVLAAYLPLQGHAAQNIWNNGAANFLWDTTSANWTGPTIWNQGDNAIFGATGAGSIGLGTDIHCSDMTFNFSYDLNANGKYLTNESATGQSVITSAAGTSNNLALSIWGTNSMSFEGPGTTVLLGDSAVNDANHYTGGTYVRGGTVIVRATGAANGGVSFGLGNILAIDTGATVQIGTQNDGTVNTVPPNGQIQQGNGAQLVLTGGTLDENGNNNSHNYPPFSGTGTIVNNSPYIRAVHKVSGGTGTPLTGTPYVFTGQIKDGGSNVTTSQGIAYQMNVDMNGGNYAPMVWGGSNSFTGFLRLNSGPYGNMIKLMPGGTLGYSAPTNFPARHILMNNGCIDLNGTSQKVGYVFTGNNENSIITNSAIGTTSTLIINNFNTAAFNGAATPRGIRCALQDDPATGGALAITKEGPGIQPIGTYSGDGTPLPNNYHGDTTVNDGILEIVSTAGISPNSAYRLNTPGVLQLDYSGTAEVKKLFVNGLQKANGIYGAAQFPGIITGDGIITVTGATGLDNTWNNGSGNFTWNTTSANWTSPTIWNQGDSAIFGLTGAGAIFLEEDIACANMTFNASYTINANGRFFTNSSPTGQSVITSAAGTSNNLALSIFGTNSMSFEGTGTTVLQGDPAAGDANHYTGGTYVRSGRLVLQAVGASSGGGSYAVDRIEALDAGATLVIPGTWNGVDGATSVRDQIAANLPGGSRLNMTGGTLDMYNDPKNQRVPAPEGTGLIINTGPNIQSGLQCIINTTDLTFNGVIADGNNGVLSTNNNFNGGPGYQIGIVQLNNGANGSGGVWHLGGANTYSGSTRIDAGPNGGIRLVGNGTIGFPTPNGLTGPMRIVNGSFFDLNGRNQTMSLLQNSGTAGLARIFNSAVGTVSTLTIGYGMEQVVRTCSYQLKDNEGVGGVFALRKINSAPYINGLIPGNTSIMATNCEQVLAGVNTYSGDTTIDGGILTMAAESAVSPNSAYRININATNNSKLRLTYAGNANARQLWINGVQQPNGVYGAGTTGIDAPNGGTITVTGFSAPPTLGVSRSGNTLNFSWTGSFKLQSQTNSLSVGIGTNWFDFPGGGSSPTPATISPANGSVFFRLAPLP